MLMSRMSTLLSETIRHALLHRTAQARFWFFRLQTDRSTCGVDSIRARAFPNPRAHRMLFIKSAASDREEEVALSSRANAEVFEPWRLTDAPRRCLPA